MKFQEALIVVLRNVGVLPDLGSTDLGLERRAEQRQVAVAFDPPQPLREF